VGCKSGCQGSEELLLPGGSPLRFSRLPPTSERSRQTLGRLLDLNESATKARVHDARVWRADL